MGDYLQRLHFLPVPFQSRVVISLHVIWVGGLCELRSVQRFPPLGEVKMLPQAGGCRAAPRSCLTSQAHIPVVVLVPGDVLLNP